MQVVQARQATQSVQVSQSTQAIGEGLHAPAPEDGGLATHPDSQGLLAGRGLPPRCYVITNQKGGQGKTTTAVGLGAEWAAAGERVRVMDCDPQLASLTYWLLPQWDDVGPDRRFDMHHVLLGEATLDEATWPTVVPGLYIVPCFKTVSKFENERPPGADLVLRQALEEAQPYDITLIDCPPNLGLLTVTAITSADDVIIPVLPGALDLAGVSDLNHTLNLVRRRLNPALTVTAIALRRMYRTGLHAAIEQQLRSDYPDAIHQVIRHATRAQEAPSVNRTLRDYAPTATVTADYQQFASRLDEAATRKAAQ
jgi:chromosome partitioning protein